MTAGVVPRAAALAAVIADVPPRERDAFIDTLLRTPELPRPAARIVQGDDELIDCIPSGVASVAGALLAAQVGPEDVFVDVGSGLGTVAILAHLLTGATAIGVEIQPRLVEASRKRASELALGGVTFVEADARDAALPAGSVFYLYTPFTGGSMRRVFERLRAAAQARQIAICTLGFDLERADWLHIVDDDSIFLSVHESHVPGSAPRKKRDEAATYLRTLAIRDRAADDPEGPA